MMPVFLKFLKDLTIYTAIIGIVTIGFVFFLPEKFITPVLYYILIFFYSVTLIMYYVLLKASEKKLSKFSINFLLLTFIKLMLYFGVILTYVFIYRNDAANFIITFFIFYLLYTSFEVISIVRKPNSELPNDKPLDKV